MSRLTARRDGGFHEIHRQAAAELNRGLPRWREVILLGTVRGGEVSKGVRGDYNRR